MADKGNWKGLIKFLKSGADPDFKIPADATEKEIRNRLLNSEEFLNKYGDTVEDMPMQMAMKTVDTKNEAKSKNPTGFLTALADSATFNFSDEIADLLQQKELAKKMRKSKQSEGYLAGTLASIPLTMLFSEVTGPGLIQKIGNAKAISSANKARLAGTTGKVSRAKQFMYDTILPSAASSALYGAGDPIGDDRLGTASAMGLIGAGVPIGLKGLQAAGASGLGATNEILNSEKLADFINKRLSAGQAGAQIDRTGDAVLDKYLGQNRHLYQGYGGASKEFQKLLNEANPDDIMAILQEAGEKGNPSVGLKNIRNDSKINKKFAQNNRSKAVLDAIDELPLVASSPRNSLFELLDKETPKHNILDIILGAGDQTISDSIPKLGGINPPRGTVPRVSNRVADVLKKTRKDFLQQYGLDPKTKNLSESGLQQLDDFIKNYTENEKSLIRMRPDSTSYSGSSPEEDLLTSLGINLQQKIREKAKTDPRASNASRQFQAGQEKVSEFIDFLPGKKFDLHKKMKGVYEKDSGVAEPSIQGTPTDTFHNVVAKRGSVDQKEYDALIDRLFEKPYDVSKIIESGGATPSFDLSKFDKARKVLKEQELINSMAEASPGSIRAPLGQNNASTAYKIEQLFKKTLFAPEFDNFVLSRAKDTPVFKETLSDYIKKTAGGKPLTPVQKILEKSTRDPRMTRNIAPITFVKALEQMLGEGSND